MSNRWTVQTVQTVVYNFSFFKKKNIYRGGIQVEQVWGLGGLLGLSGLGVQRFERFGFLRLSDGPGDCLDLPSPP